MKSLLISVVLRVLRQVFGVTITDQRTGNILGKVLIIRWKGGLRLIGLEGMAVKPVFLSQPKEVYWAQDLGFSTHEEPDFPNVTNNNHSDNAPES
jgi:hypothetical protein